MTDSSVRPTSEVTVALELNGEHVRATIPAHRTLLDMLRDDLGLCGTKRCCAEGECGACSVLLDGELVNSCLVLGAEADGGILLTIEGVSMDGVTDLQEEFLAAGAVQCGVCIPGQVMAAEQLLQTNPDASRDEIRDAMSGNLCRCASYQRIVEAIQTAAAGRQTDA